VIPRGSDPGVASTLERARQAVARDDWLEAARLLSAEQALWRSASQRELRMRSLLRSPADLRRADLQGVVREILEDREGGRESMGRAFIVHGWDNELKWEVKNYFTSVLMVECVVLHEQDGEGATLVDKFERFAKASDLAVILLSEKDEARQEALASPDALRRPRPNVLFEMGYFFALLGRSRVVLLKKGNVEINSDVLGIEYIDVTHGVEAAGEQLRRRVEPWQLGRP
jgi:hypothetical protein